MNDEKKRQIEALNKDIQEADFDVVVEAELKTSERVLKRVTDGIYRQPSSALRELIVNSYDADATLVEVQTDAPRFKRIIVRDDGNGLSTKALSYLINSIGGSAKRTTTGKDIGICAQDDRTRSPGGRKLIGKIGIGLFSVAQLTKEFQIITKTKGSDYRMIADIVLHSYSEESGDPDTDFKTGTVQIWRVPAADKESHGTEVVLRNLLKQTWEDLTSKERWLRCSPEKMLDFGDIAGIADNPPAFHIGCVHAEMPDEIDKQPCLPWEPSDAAESRFPKLVAGMYGLRTRTRNPSILDELDYYLRMLWTLGLSLPLDYVDGHPLDLTAEDGLRIFRFGNASKDQAMELANLAGKSVRQELKMVSPERGGAKDFRVFFDGIQLFRPIKFQGLPRTLESVPYSLLFVGKDKPDLYSFPEEVRGGDHLEFEAYFFWNHVVVPKEHAGVMIRINDANGVLFDTTFMQYPIAELTRKSQLTAEIFVTKGLDAALNIDRESFNYSHPHYQYLTHWVHNAFRQFSNKHKAIAKEIREATRDAQNQTEIDALQKNINDLMQELHPNEFLPVPEVQFVDDETNLRGPRERGILAFQREKVFEPHRFAPDTRFEERIGAVARVLDAYGVFNDMPYEKQQALLRQIVRIFSY